MKSVGEAMAIGRNFPEAFQKALRSLEKKGSQFTFVGDPGDKETLLREAVRPTDGRINTVMQAIRAGATPQEVFDYTKIDPWFVDQLFLIKEIADELAGAPGADRRRCSPRPSGTASPTSRSARSAACARTWSARSATPSGSARSTRRSTPARRSSRRRRRTSSSYDEESEVARREKPAVIILGSGPNRIGQGIEFDYSCVHASFALSEAGYETVMVNCNPETVSTDYDTSDRLYSSPSPWRMCWRSSTPSSRRARSRV